MEKSQIQRLQHAALAADGRQPWALVGSYLSADKLDRIMVGLVVFVFSASCVGFAMEGYHLGVDLAGAARAVNSASLEPGSTLRWTSFAQGMTVDHVPISMWMFFVGLYLSVLIFSSGCARRDLKRRASRKRILESSKGRTSSAFSERR